MINEISLSNRIFLGNNVPKHILMKVVWLRSYDLKCGIGIDIR